VRGVDKECDRKGLETWQRGARPHRGAPKELNEEVTGCGRDSEAPEKQI